jgi:hypothetical protein
MPKRHTNYKQKLFLGKPIFKVKSIYQLFTFTQSTPTNSRCIYADSNQLILIDGNRIILANLILRYKMK